MSLYDDAMAAGRSSLEQQIIAKWGRFGDWGAAGQDQVGALATLLEQNGVTDLSKLTFKPRDVTTGGGTYETESGTATSTPTTTKDAAFDAFYDGKQVGFLGDINAGGQYERKDELNNFFGDAGGKLHGQGDLLGWSAQGGGHTGFKVMMGPDGEPVVAPEWGSSSEDSYWAARSAAQVAAFAAAGYYGAGDPTAASGGAAATGMDVAALDVGLTGVTEGTLATVGTEAGMTAAQVAAQQAAQDAAIQQIVVTGSKIAPTTIGAGELAVGAGAAGTLAELGTIPETIPDNVEIPDYTDDGGTPMDPPDDFGREHLRTPTDHGRTLPDSAYTPITEGAPDQTIIPPPGGDTVVPPPTTPPPGGGVTPPIVDPTKISDWASLFNVLSGLYGLKLANDAADKSDPFGPYRKGYADKLLALEANPGSIQNTPGYRAGTDNINRTMVSRGYLGSGNQAGALQRFSGDFYNNEANRLATLAGANINPGNTYFNQAQLTGQALSNIGYGLSPYMQGGPK